VARFSEVLAGGSDERDEEEKPVRVAMVVPASRKQVLLECVDALFHQTRPLDWIYVTDEAKLGF
jgi:hypothetical protein